jgi:NifU-like protein involved in Fe-S cluster formation
MYSKQIADHITNPRNVGEIENPSGVGDVTNQVCLDRIRLTITVSDGKVTEARFKANGCPPTIAAASALTELIIGSTLEDAQCLEKSDIVDRLGKLPSAKTHCAMLAIDALKAALAAASQRK